MSNLKERVTAASGFFSNVLAEAKKATWPTRQELMSSTLVVIVSVVLLGLFVGVCDWILLQLLQLLVQSGGR